MIKRAQVVIIRVVLKVLNSVEPADEGADELFSRAPKTVNHDDIIAEVFELFKRPLAQTFTFRSLLSKRYSINLVYIDFCRAGGI